MASAAIIKEVLAGRRMSNEEFENLYKKGDFLAIGSAADEMRNRRFPDDIVTFVIDRNINYTNICSCRCKFCAFYRSKDDPDAYVIEPGTLHKKIEDAVALGATQLMIQGGLNKDLGIDFFEKMFKDIKSRYNITIHSLTAPEIVFIARNCGLSIQDTLLRLRAAGLDSLPGGGAEILHDEVRRQISPDKISSAQWLEVMKTAHHIGMKTTATMMMGSVEQLEHRIHHLEQIRSLQDETGGFRAFIAWTYQPGNNELMGRKMSSVLYLKFLALSRLYLDNFDHIQGSWVTQGERVGQLSLFFGADDLGSVMLEENVVRAAGLGYQMHTDKMVQMIQAAGKTAALRDTEYNVLRRF